MTKYEERVLKRSAIRYYIGLIMRWRINLRNRRICNVARKNGAEIGEAVVMPMSLAKIANANLYIGNHVSIQTDDIDLRSPIKIGNNVIIGKGVKILTASHDIDSPEWDFKTYGIVIEDYVWVATSATVLPSCRKLSYGTVVGGGALVYKDSEPMDVLSGNPAIVIRKRKFVHSKLVVESLLGGDYDEYKRVRRGGNKKDRDFPEKDAKTIAR